MRRTIAVLLLLAAQAWARSTIDRAGPSAIASRSPIAIPTACPEPAIHPRLARSFHLRERAGLESPFESFHLFNHVNYTSEIARNYTSGGTAAAPVLTCGGNFGQLTAANHKTVLGPRQIRIGACIAF